MTDTKALGVLTADIKDATTDNGDGTYRIVLSVPTVDRDGEVIDAKAFEPLPDWLNIDIDHGMSVLTTVGSGVPAYEGDALVLNDFRFASTALGQDVKTLVDEKHVRKMSVAFMAAQREVDEKDGKPHVRKAELLNAAVVAIPSNREADILVGAKRFAADLHRETRTVKAVAGSYEDRADRLRQALRSEHPEAEWLWVRATFEDSVVFEVEDPLGGIHTYQAGYTAEGDSFTFDEATEVDLAEVIVPPVKSHTLNVDISGDAGAKTTDTDPEQPAAPAAGSPDIGSVVQARAFLVRATQTLHDLAV